jgi:hypothetical protein
MTVARSKSTNVCCLCHRRSNESELLPEYYPQLFAEKLGRPEPDGKQLIVSNGLRLLTEKGDLIIEDVEEHAYPALEDSSRREEVQAFRAGESNSHCSR